MNRIILNKTIIFALLGVLILSISNRSVGHVYANEAYSVGRSENYDNYIEEYESMSDMENISDDLDTIMEENNTDVGISFKKIYSMLISGNVDEAVSEAVSVICEGMTKDIMENRTIILQLFLLVIIAAVFSNYSSILKFSYVGEQGFYVTYLMSAVLLMKSFSLVYEISDQTIRYIKEMMECILPAFSMSLIMCSGITTSHVAGGFFIWMLTLMEKLMLSVVLPGARIYFLIVLLNQIGGRDRFSKLASLIRQGIEWTLKMLVTGVVGVNMVKSMIAPVYENVRFNAIRKGISMLPGGGTFTGVSSIFLGTGVLIKNSVGVGGIIFLIIAGGIPLIKIIVFNISYRLVLAFTQPISDTRILSGIEGAINSAEILLRAVITSMALCILSIAIVIVSTNVRFYAV